MSYTFTENYVLFRMEQVQKELGVFDLLDWTKLVAGYDINPKLTTYKGYVGIEAEEKDRIVAELRERLATMPEIKRSKPAHMRQHVYHKAFLKSTTLYSAKEIIDAFLASNQNANIATRLNMPTDIRETSINGETGIDETEKDRIMAILQAQLDGHMAEVERIERDRALGFCKFLGVD